MHFHESYRISKNRSFEQIDAVLARRIIHVVLKVPFSFAWSFGVTDYAFRLVSGHPTQGFTLNVFGWIEVQLLPG